MSRGPVPKKIAESPELDPWLELFYTAFMCLTTCRGTGYSTEGAIGWLAINAYCHECEIFDEQREDLFYHVQHMDAAYLNYKAKKLKAEMTKE